MGVGDGGSRPCIRAESDDRRRKAAAAGGRRVVSTSRRCCRRSGARPVRTAPAEPITDRPRAISGRPPRKHHGLERGCYGLVAAYAGQVRSRCVLATRHGGRGDEDYEERRPARASTALGSTLSAAAPLSVTLLSRSAPLFYERAAAISRRAQVALSFLGLALVVAAACRGRARARPWRGLRSVESRSAADTTVGPCCLQWRPISLSDLAVGWSRQLVAAALVLHVCMKAIASCRYSGIVSV